MNQEVGCPGTKFSQYILDVPASRAVRNTGLLILAAQSVLFGVAAQGQLPLPPAGPISCSQVRVLSLPLGTFCSCRTNKGCGQTPLPSSQLWERGRGCSSPGVPLGYTSVPSLSPSPRGHHSPHCRTCLGRAWVLLSVHSPDVTL